MSDADPVDSNAAGVTTGRVVRQDVDATAKLHSMLDAVLDESVRIPGQPAWIIACGYHIGETSNFCAFAREFVKVHGHGIVLIVRNIHIHVASMYAHNFLKVVAIPDDMITSMLYTSYIPPDRFELNQPISACWIDRGFRGYDGIRYLSRYSGRGGITDTDLMRLVLRLPWNARMEPPQIVPEWEQQAWDLARQVGLRIGRSVLLCPINNTGKKVPDVFWVVLAQRLNEQGYTVFTNMGGLSTFNTGGKYTTNGLDEMPVPGTTPINLPINLVIPFAHFAGRVITGANGMSFLMMLAGLKTFRITQLISGVKDVPDKHASWGERGPYPVKGAELMSAYQFLCPELCLGASFNEFLIYADEPVEELRRLAQIVADQNTDDDACIKRFESNGKRYIDEHADWLRDLT